MATVERKMIRNPRFVIYCYVPNTVTNEEEYVTSSMQYIHTPSHKIIFKYITEQIHT